jgi:hypothetical protein
MSTDPARALPASTDARALARFDVFLCSAVATVLVVRAALAITGYPQVGGNGLHVAHVLWGGLLMGVAVVMLVVSPGSRARARAALVGGIGFGLFIDEVGKFLTKDVNYFFKPAVAIIYATFVAFYIVTREVLRYRPMTDRRRLAIAAQALADLSLNQLDRASRDHALAMLAGISGASELAGMASAVRAGLECEPPSRPGPARWAIVVRDEIDVRATRILASPVAQWVVLALFVVQAVDVVVSVALSFARPGGPAQTRTFVDTGLPGAVSSVLIVAGVVVLLGGRRADALRLLQGATLVELLFTQVVVFNRQQWLGLIGFAISLTVLAALRVAERPQPVAAVSRL